MENFVSYEDMFKIVKGLGKKSNQTIVNSDVQVGHVMWQMYLVDGYLKLDGSQLSNAKTDYYDLWNFATLNNLITTDTTNLSLFQYDSTNDVLTLPNWMDKTVWSGTTVEEKEAGLPNITGTIVALGDLNTALGDWNLSGAFYDDTTTTIQNSFNHTNKAITTRFPKLDASRSNSIYGNSTTVQPPAFVVNIWQRTA